jgi:branched-chain amino acid transport system substrate-binding protein
MIVARGAVLNARFALLDRRRAFAATSPAPKEEFMNVVKKTIAAAAVAALVPAFAAAQEAPLKIGVVSFLSGAAAGPFGVPARNAAEITIEMLNGSKWPAPYATKGGHPLQLQLDEAGSTTTQVTGFATWCSDNVTS